MKVWGERKLTTGEGHVLPKRKRAFLLDLQGFVDGWTQAGPPGVHVVAYVCSYCKKVIHRTSSSVEEAEEFRDLLRHDRAGQLCTGCAGLEERP